MPVNDPWSLRPRKPQTCSHSGSHMWALTGHQAGRPSQAGCRWTAGPGRAPWLPRCASCTCSPRAPQTHAMPLQAARPQSGVHPAELHKRSVLDLAWQRLRKPRMCGCTWMPCHALRAKQSICASANHAVPAQGEVATSASREVILHTHAPCTAVHLPARLVKLN